MEEANEHETSARPPLRGFFFPLLSPGHMIPLIDIAVLLSRRGVAATIVTTPGNEPLARTIIDRANSHPFSNSTNPIELIILPFPPSAAHLLPSDNRENLTNLQLSEHHLLMAAVDSLRPSLHDLLVRRRADFLVSDAILIWTADLALELGIPRIVFDGPGAFPLCVNESLMLSLNNPSGDDTYPILLNDLPDLIDLTRPELSEIFQFPKFLQLIKEAEEKSFGVVVNTFLDLEPAYADLFRCRREARRAWFIGPVSLSKSNKDDINIRGETAGLMSWLDGQPVRSVVYACFGSLCQFDAGQMREIAAGLECSGHRFIWAVREWKGAAAPFGWLPEGFEEAVEGKGRVVKGWAPQVAILGHAAVGAFVTHCGWNSTLEGVAAGVPLVAWPLMFEQFVNERLITDVLRVGLRVRGGRGRAAVAATELTAAVKRVMGDGEEAEGLRRRAMEFAELGRKAVEVGGSSYDEIGRMVKDLGVEVQLRRVLGAVKETRVI